PLPRDGPWGSYTGGAGQHVRYLAARQEAGHRERAGIHRTAWLCGGGGPPLLFSVLHRRQSIALAVQGAAESISLATWRGNHWLTHLVAALWAGFPGSSILGFEWEAPDGACITSIALQRDSIFREEHHRDTTGTPHTSNAR